MNNTQLLQELQLIKFGLLPDEILAFLGDTGSGWIGLLDDYCEDPSSAETAVSWPSAPPHLQIKFAKSSSSSIWLEVQFSSQSENAMPFVSVKGDTLARGDQERWQNMIQTKMEEVTASDTDVPVYELLCLHLLPLLHDELLALSPQSRAPLEDVTSSVPTRFHALFTSHHLISPKKRRSLQQWSNSLTITGFAKVGYPGVIYAQGEQGNVEEFVENVKAMQWLALRLRFLEPLPEGRGGDADAHEWVELEKVGEAVERMRQLGLENWIVEMGIGSRTS